MVVDLALAPLSILAFLGSCLAVVAGFAMLIFAKITKRAKLVKGVGIFLAAGIGFYALLLIGSSLFSKEYVLGRGAEKHFCEVDCHIAYSVTDVRQAKTIGEGGAARNAQGVFYIVTVRTRFDESTINPKRGNAILYPNPREIYAVDAQSRHFLPLAADSAQQIEKPLHPAEAYDTQVVFDIPADARDPRMFIKNLGWPNYLLIGHENSFFHKKAYFDLRS